jgi:hypothetical protein
MDNTQTLNRKYKTIAWGLLSILWGITILFDFVPFGVGLTGTGLIFLGVNLVRSFNGLPTKGDNTVIGILALVWGGLDLALPLLRLRFKVSDWDWAIFAILLVVLGVILLARALLQVRKTGLGNSH